MIRVYVDMVADLFHVGHLNLIQSARKFGDTLIVGIHSDEDVSSYKRMPIINEKDRYEMVRSCRYVDEVIEEAPLKITKEFLDSIDMIFMIRETTFLRWMDELPYLKEIFFLL